MDLVKRRFALRMIPYGVHVVTALDAAGGPVAATAHWVTQTSFEPPLVKVMEPVGTPMALVGSLTLAVMATAVPLGTGFDEKLSTFKVYCWPVTTWVTPGDVEVA